MCVDVRLLCAWVTVMAVIYVTAAVGPRRPSNNDINSVDSREDYLAGQPGLATCGAALLQELYTITDLVLSISNQTAMPLQPPEPPPVVQDCSSLRLAGIQGSGVYHVFPFTFKVYCDMVKHGGGWTVIQRRQSQRVQENFARDWSSYREGFGELRGEMWLGLEALHLLTHSAHYELRVDMVDYELGRKYAHYQVFQVGAEEDGYRLLVANYSGDAGDALSYYHSGRRFSTFDRDQDMTLNKSCAQDKEGGWWFDACYSAHPNGCFPATLGRTDSKNIRWWKSREQVLVLTYIEMKIRRRASRDVAVVRGEDTADSNSNHHDQGLDQDDDHVLFSKEEEVGHESDDYPAHNNHYDVEGRSDILP
ncbi:microfibril-associated glycoprotein 4-like [Portunus trituberculatus]|uniref:microfibril-associated glycoprotein 4-like n=1 Tax=Portunus trituberculatus TaxID=210409 RepID=UPI001E1CC5BC|nr:microfibril-associated glycoprotein 4-like [Portunus trituberculatus]